MRKKKMLLLFTQLFFPWWRNLQHDEANTEHYEDDIHLEDEECIITETTPNIEQRQQVDTRSVQHSAVTSEGWGDCFNKKL